LERTPDDLDTTCWPWILHLGERDKAGDRVQIPLAEHVIEAIQAIPNWREQKWLFGTTSVSNINRDIKKACVKAGVPYFSTHPLGRHKAARNFIRARGSLKGLQEAYRWKDPDMPMRHYGHEEESEITAMVHEVGRAFWDNVKLRAYESGTKQQPEVGRANLGQIEQTAQSASQPKPKNPIETGR